MSEVKDQTPYLLKCPMCKARFVNGQPQHQLTCLYADQPWEMHAKTKTIEPKPLPPPKLRKH